jgi:hypothetical protein
MGMDDELAMMIIFRQKKRVPKGTLSLIKLLLNQQLAAGN